MKKYFKLIGFGFLTWLIPFVVAMPFYSRTGEILVNQDFFKSIMIVTGALTGAILLVIYFKKVQKNYLRESIIVGLTWLVINYLLDFLVLLPMSGMSVTDYILQISLRYLNMPITSVALGVILKQKSKNLKYLTGAIK